MEKEYTPQQPVVGLPGVTPARGWVPAVSPSLNPIGIYDTKRGLWVGFPQEALTEALVAAESLHAVDRLDERNHATATVPDASEVGTVRTKELEVPAGEVWFINRFNLITEAEVSGNVRVSKFPKVDDVDKRYLGTDQAASQDLNYDLASVGQLGVELRLVGGDKLTVVATATVDPTTDERSVTLNVFGRKARRLVE